MYDGAWPIIAGRRVSLNARFAQPDGALKLYEAGSEGPQWWMPMARPGPRSSGGGHPRSLHREQHVPEDHRALRRGGDVGAEPESGDFVGHVGRQGHSASEQRAPVLHPEHAARRRQRRLQRHAADGARHARVRTSAAASFAANPVPHTETVNALRVHFRNWVMKDTPPPPSKYPTLADGYLVDPTKDATGIPDDSWRACRVRRPG